MNGSKKSSPESSRENTSNVPERAAFWLWRSSEIPAALARLSDFKGSLVEINASLAERLKQKAEALNVSPQFFVENLLENAVSIPPFAPLMPEMGESLHALLDAGYKLVSHVLCQDDQPGQEVGATEIHILKSPEGNFVKVWIDAEEFNGSEWKLIGEAGPKFSERRIAHRREEISRAEVLRLVNRYLLPRTLLQDFAVRDLSAPATSVSPEGAEVTINETVALLETLFDRVDLHCDDPQSALADALADGLFAAKNRVVTDLMKLRRGEAAGLDRETIREAINAAIVMADTLFTRADAHRADSDSARSDALADGLRAMKDRLVKSLLMLRNSLPHRETWHPARRAGQSAALRGCLRVLACPASPQEEKEWLAGFDSVPRENRGKWPRVGFVPAELQHLAN